MIRPAEAADVQQIANLVRSSFAPALHPYMIYTQPGITSFLLAYICVPQLARDRRFLVANDDDGAILAFADFRVLVGGGSFLSYICVAPAARGRGLATAMIDAFLKAVPNRQEMQLDVFSNNDVARALYGRLGFQTGGTTHWYARPLPQAVDHNGDLTLLDPPSAAANFDAYGFCQLKTIWRGSDREAGRMGSRVIRCFSVPAFEDSEFLAALQFCFPNAEEALLVGSACSVPGSRLINETVRMVWKIAG